MSEPKHTPGRWETVMDTPGSSIEIVTDGPKGRMELATVHKECEYGPNPLPMKANARLIAAAPELLIGLKYARNVMANRRAAPVELDDIDDIIAQAEGTE